MSVKSAFSLLRVKPRLRRFNQSFGAEAADTCQCLVSRTCLGTEADVVRTRIMQEGRNHTHSDVKSAECPFIKLSQPYHETLVKAVPAGPISSRQFLPSHVIVALPAFFEDGSQPI